MKLRVLLLRTITLGACFGLASLAACGSESSEFPEGSSSGQSSGNSGPGIGTSGGRGDGGGLSEDGQFAKCTEARDAAKRLPLHLVLLLDRSSSMCCYDQFCQRVGDQEPHRDCSKPGSRWAVTTGALASFFNAPETTGISMSVLPFPAEGDRDEQCTADYSDEVSSSNVALPTDFGAELVSLEPEPTGYVTPTTPAFDGALAVARSLRASVPAEDTVAILFATDGQPKDCGSSFQPDHGFPDADISRAAAAAATGSAEGIRTYVIGLDDPNENLSDNLKALANAAGTAPPALISLTDPTQAANQLKDALNAIRGKALGCELIVPAPPAGKTLDPKKVNVVYRPGDGGDSTILPYSADCSDKSGWFYDDPQKPTRITLCADACKLAQDDPEGRLEVVLGCETQGAPVN